MLVVSSCGSHTVYSPSRHIYTVGGAVQKTENESADAGPLPDDFLLASTIASDVILVGTVVREGDALVLFLFQEKQDGRYYPSQVAFYAINPPDDTLFSFSADETLTSFDGKSVNTLKKAIEKKLKEFGKVEEDYVYWCGAVGKEYRSQALMDWLNGD